MPEPTNCISCETEIAAEDVVRPEYLVKATGRTICPLPRCAVCRAAYEAEKTGLEVVD